MDRLRQMSAKKSLDTALDSVASLASRVLGQPHTPPPSRQRAKRHVRFFTLDVEVSKRVSLRIVSVKRRELFSAVLGELVPDDTEFSVRRFDDQLVVKFIGYATLTITHVKQEQSERYDVEWRMAIDGQGCFQDSISLCYNEWFGGCMTPEQSWPLSCQHKLSPFVSWDTHYDPDSGYGSALERYWLSSSGVAVYVDSEVPLFVAMTNEDSNQALTLVSKFEKPYRNLFDYNLFLKYSIIESPNLKVTHDLIRKEYFLKPEAMPSSLLFHKTIWSTSHLSADVSDDTVLQFVEELLDQGFNPGILEFADDWTPAYGDTIFDPNRFANSKKMIQTIRNKGFNVVLWVHPFASPRSAAFYEGSNLWVKSSMIEGVTAWTHGPAKLLDVTNPDARTWFKKKLNDLKEDHSIDGFLFDYGQINYMPSLANTYDPLSNPNMFTRNYIGTATDMAYEKHLSMVRCGAGTQNAAVMICLEEKSSSWGWNNGLKTVIPGVLTLGLIGYLFVVPGYVGGSEQSDMDRELYVRWLETVLFMPAVKFSVPPWKLGIETLDIVKNLIGLRKSRLEYLEKVAAESKESGEPMIKPLWWRAPNDTITHTIDSQFMLGDDLMVAPVQEKGMTNRSIYLPWGVWKDELRGTTIQGKQWLYSYRAKLGELPHFTLVTQEDEAAKKQDT